MAKRIPFLRTQTAVAALLVAGSMAAGSTASAQQSAAVANPIEEIVVTGTRIVRDGYEIGRAHV